MLFPNLKNFWRNIGRDKLLLLALTVGFLLRVLNPTFGSPSLYISNDEAITHLSAWNMLAEKSPVSIANYTPLFSYLQIPFILLSFATMKILGMVKDISDFEFFVLTHEGYFLYIPRLLSGMFGTLTILVMYKITLLLFRLRGEKNSHFGGVSDARNVALIASFLSAVSFNMVHISHFGRPWAAALFFTMLSVYFALKRRTVASFGMLGISYGFHQMGILLLPLLLLLSIKRKGAIWGFVIFTLMVIIFGSLTLKTGLIESIKNGQSFLNPEAAIGDFLNGMFGLESIINTLNGNLVSYYLANLLVTDGIILIFAILGIFRNIARNSQNRVVGFFILIYFVFASLFFYSLIRYLLPIILLLIPFAAIGIYDLIFVGLRNSKVIGILLISMICFLASVNSVWWNYFYLKTPTFIQAHAWIEENISSDVPIGYIGGRYQTFVPRKEAIKYIQKFKKGYYNRLLQILPNGQFDNMRNMVYVSSLEGKTKIDPVKQAAYDYNIGYAIDYYLDPADRVYNQRPEVFESVQIFNPVRKGELIGIPEPLFDASSNFKTYDKREKVSMYSLWRYGPIVEILKIKSH